MNVDGNMGFVTSGDTTGDVVKYKVGVPDNWIGLKSVLCGLPEREQVHVLCTVSCCTVCISLVTVIDWSTEGAIGTRTGGSVVTVGTLGHP